VIDLIREAAGVQSFIEARGWGFCFIGGLAVLRWGEPRFTADMDLTLLTGFGGEAPYVDSLLERYRARLPGMRKFALENRVLLLSSDGGIAIDVALGGLPFEEAAVAGGSPFEFSDGLFLRTCGADDLVVMKAFADRDRDWEDVRGVLIRQQARLNWDVIWERLEPLCAAKENPGILDKLRTLRGQL
jgi:hypothetical protein